MPARPPHLIFLLTDDHRWDALGCAGNPVLRTPHLDALAAGGTRFPNAFVTTSICCASRASVFTGQWARRNGVHDFATPFTPAQHARTYPGLLRAAGYRTGFVGKYGVGDNAPPPAERFDYWRGFTGQGVYEGKDGVHITDRMTRQALEFLEDPDTDRPFCLSVSYKAPHHQDGDPRQYIPAARHRGLYADAVVAPPPGQDFDALPPFLQRSEGRVRWALRFDTPERHAESVRNYYRLIQGVDDSVGEIVQALRRTGRERDTVIVFLGDNGCFLGEHGLGDKWLLYEESVRVPLIVHDPRLPERRRGRVEERMALNVDIAPTLLELAGVRRPRAMQGRSLVPLLEGRRTTWRRDWFYEHLFPHPGIPRSEGVRTERWVYWRYLDHPEADECLFDLRTDPHQVRNRVADPDARPVLEDLRRRTARYRDRLR